MTSDTLVESHSFDYVPESERHGNVRSQVQLWFMVNAQILTLYTGAVGISQGLSLGWSLVAILAGSLVGTLFQAFHGAQGPVMGLPQMIQSRVQFGSRGVLLPILAATLSPFGFAVFLLQTASSAINGVTGLSATGPTELALAIVAGLIAIMGFRLVMKVEKLASYLTLLNFALLSVAVVTVLPIGDLFAHGSFIGTAFLAQFGASAVYQLAIAPLVSDYTRYLPARTSGARVSAAVFAGTTLSAVWLEGIGAVVTAAYPQLDTIAAVKDLGDSFGFGLGTITMLVAMLTCLITTAITGYSGALALISGLDAFRALKPTAALRSATIAIGMVLVLLCSLFMSQDTLGAFGSFLSILGYVLIPWTAVNLTDYYFVRNGRYSITDIMRPDGGIYGNWGGIGIASYLLGLVVMIPFISCGIYTGPLARALGGADLSFVIGLLVASLAYLLLARRLDLAAEMQHVARVPLNTLGH